MDDKLFAPDKNDFPQEIGEAGKFGIIEEEEKGNKKKTWSCPKCGAEKIKAIIYGYPDLEKIKKDDFLGGCCVDDDSPKWHCLNCNHEWGKY